MAPGKPAQVYFLLGTPASGRRGVVLDLVENGLDATDPVLVLVAEGEPADPVLEKLSARPLTEVRRWRWAPPELPDQELPPGGYVFFLADASTDPLSQIEALKTWLVRQGAELARLLCFVDCQFAEKNPPLRPWYDALVHFSDVVFLTKRAGVANKWLSDFVRHFEDQFIPSHFIQLKKGGVPNPALVLIPEIRRVSQYFEEEAPLPVAIETEDEEDGEEAEPDEDAIQPEPYFVRDRSGRREKELPDIRKYLA
ncbi:MAG: hypothetical protein ACHQ5A_04855 [Opitutales bacterium]